MATARPAGLAADFGWALRSVSMPSRPSGVSAIRDIPGGARAYLTLVAVGGGCPPSQLALARRIGIDKTAMTYVLDGLEGAGLVTRAHDPADGRARLIAITDHGRTAVRQARDRLRDVEDHLIGVLGTKDAATFRALIARVADARVPEHRRGTAMNRFADDTGAALPTFGELSDDHAGDRRRSTAASPPNPRRTTPCPNHVRDRRPLDAHRTHELGAPDILVNNVGIYPRIDFPDIALDDWRRVFAINVESILLMAQTFVPGMQAKGWGRIVNVGSNNVALQIPGATHYIASKMAVVGLTRGLATELAQDGITANVLAPSITRTPGAIAGGMTDAGFAALAQMQSIKRTEVPADLAGSAAFLASDDAEFMTGQVLYVDGGLVRSL